jgi:hypothetical protein
MTLSMHVCHLFKVNGPLKAVLLFQTCGVLKGIRFFRFVHCLKVALDLDPRV